MDRSIPYVNYSLLSKYIGQLVRLICKTTQLPNNGIIVVETTDHGSANIHLNGIVISSSSYLCITGQVNKDLSLDAKAVDTFGNQLDMNNADSMINLMQKTPALFI